MAEGWKAIMTLKGYAGILSGPGYAGGYLETDSEYFPTIESAKTAMRERYRSNGWPCPVTILDLDENGIPFIGETYSTGFPCFGAEQQITLYVITDTLFEDTDPYPEYVISFGPRMGIRVERA